MMPYGENPGFVEHSNAMGGRIRMYIAEISEYLGEDETVEVISVDKRKHFTVHGRNYARLNPMALLKKINTRKNRVLLYVHQQEGGTYAENVYYEAESGI